MGTWGTSVFECDDAMDWLCDLEESKGVRFLKNSLEGEEPEGGYLEAPVGVAILCAAEIISAVRGHPSRNLPEEAAEWVKAHLNLNVEPLVPLAVRQVSRVLSEGSELLDLWKENEEDSAAWRDGVQELKDRLNLPRQGGAVDKRAT